MRQTSKPIGTELILKSFNSGTLGGRLYLELPPEICKRADRPSQLAFYRYGEFSTFRDSPRNLIGNLKHESSPFSIRKTSKWSS